MAKREEYSASKASLGEETYPMVDPSCIEELWAAARDADVDKVRECLNNGADVNGVKDIPKEEHNKESDRESDRKSGRKSGKEEVLVYRGWKMASCALHVAVRFAADETGDKKWKEQEKAVPVVKLLLSRQADVNSPATRIYKGRCRMVQAIHMAAGAGNADVVKLLLENRADINAEAILGPDGVDRRKEVLHKPIHDAVLYNHAECVRLLLDGEAEVNVVNIDKNTPLHIAANLGYVDIVEMLLGLTEARKAFEKAVDQRTEMSLKAPKPTRRNGDAFVDLVELARKAKGQAPIPKQFAAKQQELLTARNADKKTALELAAKGGRFPVDDMYWFATCLFAFDTQDEDKEELVDVFASVAVAFPPVAIDLLRIADQSCRNRDCVNVVDPQNLMRVRKALTCDKGGMKQKVFEKFVYLSDRYPEAAVVMLDALTSTPKENHPVIDPLPRRFVPPRDDLYPLHCVYEEANEWELNPEKGVKEWHKELAGDIAEAKDRHDAPEKEKDCPAEFRGPAPVPATVHVVNLQGFACPKVLSSLTRQTEDCLFTKLAVHALLKFVWDSMNALFVLDMIYEGVAIIIISRWIVTTPEDVAYMSGFFNEFLNRLAWCIVAGQGTLEAVILTWTAIRHKLTLGHEDAMSWASRNSHRICLSVMTVTLACASQEDKLGFVGLVQVPMEINGGSPAGLRHASWVRAFVKTGTRLLPIMKAILPIGGMLVILSFLMVGFMHVFWAMDRSNTNEVNTWQFLTFLFIADNFINDENLGGLSQGRQYAMMVLGGISLFIFTSCSLNLFIAVLSEVYEQEQERMLVTFLKERANICSFLFLRPEIRLPDSLTEAMKRSGWKLQSALFLASAATVSLVVGCCVALKINSWPGALAFVFWAVLHQALMKHGLTKDWEKKYIWYCADMSGVEEIFSLGHSQQDQMLPQNRAWKLKKYVSEIMTQLQKHDEKFAAAQETQKADLKRVEDAQKRLESHLEKLVKLLGVEGASLTSPGEGASLKSPAEGASLKSPAASTTASINGKVWESSRREAEAESEALFEEAAQAPESAREDTSALPDVAATLIGLSPETAATPPAPAQPPKKKKAPKSGGGQRSATRASAEQSASQPANGG